MLVCIGINLCVLLLTVRMMMVEWSLRLATENVGIMRVVIFHLGKPPCTRFWWHRGFNFHELLWYTVYKKKAWFWSFILLVAIDYSNDLELSYCSFLWEYWKASWGCWWYRGFNLHLPHCLQVWQFYGGYWYRRKFVFSCHFDSMEINEGGCSFLPCWMQSLSSVILFYICTLG